MRYTALDATHPRVFMHTILHFHGACICVLIWCLPVVTSSNRQSLNTLGILDCHVVWACSVLASLHSGKRGTGVCQRSLDIFNRTDADMVFIS